MSDSHEKDRGGTGAVPTGVPAVALTPHGRRDLLDVERLLKCPDFSFTPQWAQQLTNRLLLIAFNQSEKGEEKGNWGPREQLRAQALLIQIARLTLARDAVILKAAQPDPPPQPPLLGKYVFLTAQERELERIFRSVGIEGVFDDSDFDAAGLPGSTDVSAEPGPTSGAGNDARGQSGNGNGRRPPDQGRGEGEAGPASNGP